MSDYTLFQFLVDRLLMQMPVILVCVGALFLAKSKCRQAPTVWRLAASAFVVSLVVSASNLVPATVPAWGVVWDILGPVLRAMSYLLLLMALYTACSAKAKGSADASESLLKPVIQLFRQRPGLKSVFLTIWLLVWLLVLLCSVFYGMFLPNWYGGSARIRLGPSRVDPVASAPPPVTERLNSLQTECEVIRSTPILADVVAKLHLREAWGEEFQFGAPISVDIATTMLKTFSTAYPLDGTELIEIHARSQRPEEAAAIANCIAQTYKEHVDEVQQASSVSDAGAVTIVELAMVKPIPESPDKSRYIIPGLWGGFWLGFVLAAGVMWFAMQADPKSGEDSGPRLRARFPLRKRATAICQAN